LISIDLCGVVTSAHQHQYQLSLGGMEYNLTSQTLGAIPLGGERWDGFVFVVGLNKLFGAPYDGTSVLVVDPVTNTTGTIPVEPEPSGTTNWRWSGIAFASITNRLYSAPFNSGSVLVVDTYANVSDTRTLSVQRGHMKWSGIAYVDSLAKLFCAPFSRADILVVNPLANTTSTIPLQQHPQSGMWVGFTYVASVGKLFAAPFNADSVLVFDPVTNVTDTTTLGGLSGDGFKWVNFVWIEEINKLFAYDAISVLVVDPFSNSTNNSTFANVGADIPSPLRGGIRKWKGLSVLNGGIVVAVPYAARAVLIIDALHNTSVAINLTNVTGRDGRLIDRWVCGAGLQQTSPR